MRTKTTAKRSLDLELKHFDKRHKVEPQTLRIDGDLFSLSALQRTLQDLQCVFCKEFSGGPIMRLDCSNPECSALQYFCRSHMETPSFRCDICWCCRRGGCRAADDHGVTKLFKRTLYTTCEKEGCLQLIIADDSETHLQNECTANFTTCAEMGCNKRYLVKDGHTCDSVVCGLCEEVPGFGRVGCVWRGNRRDLARHECAFRTPEAAAQMMLDFARSVSTRVHSLEADARSLRAEINIVDDDVDLDLDYSDDD
ncbi:hypothetical protein KFL_005560040 [Klebsormidium nitens]|uniref:TRAF-type domain-containing protein n=1 Tax=Klebsormidium nitens TaxID=105231 RepID=A0A1Y1IFW3_KLENI|nr:hypothetical protein KFL_005560040 [Klebsormidium nitens]|eukprot:GAQ89725.1 hypothetical protein KFL_005560040 [Klebsormidium nitens]